MAYGDQKFRHGLRNVRNSFGLAVRAYEISNDTEKVELLAMLIQAADEAITMIDTNLEDSSQASSGDPNDRKGPPIRS